VGVVRVRSTQSRDGNEPELVEALEACGFGVTPLAAMEEGTPDLLVSRRGHWHLLEVKQRHGRIRDSQKAFALKHHAHVYVLRTIDDVINLAKRLP